MIRLFNVKCVMLNVILLYTLHFTHYTTFAQPISSTELINNAKQYDGQIVVYAGEAIGDIMLRGEYSWVNVNDGKNAIGIWMDANSAKAINFTGSYKTIGDGLEITGVFHRACPEHGGDLDIHAQSMRITSPGRLVQEKLNIGKKNMAVALLIVLFVILCIIWISRILKYK